MCECVITLYDLCMDICAHAHGVHVCGVCVNWIPHRCDAWAVWVTR